MLKVRKRNLIDSTDKLRWTPLHYAACHGHLKMVRRLLREGSDPNMLTCTGTSAMHLLARIEPQGEDNKISINYIQTLKVKATFWPHGGVKCSHDSLIDVDRTWGGYESTKQRLVHSSS